MTENEKLSKISTTLGCLELMLQILVVQPIWYFLLYQILAAIHADTPMWVAFWVYVPFHLVIRTLAALAHNLDRKAGG